ncbi:MAG: hypothetical protein ACYC9O_18475 [Candidatus Latescibacterota bacterium]
MLTLTAAARPEKSKTPSEHLAQWMSQICQDAGHPLTAQQVKRIRKLRNDPSGKSRETLTAILDDAQERALKMEFRERAVQSVGELLEESDHPLTPEQEERLRKLDLNKGKPEAVEPIFNDLQREALRNNLWKETVEKLTVNMTIRLKKSGIPLTAEQAGGITELKPNADALDELLAILTEGQELALWRSYENEPEGKALIRGIELQMFRAGCPITAEQKKRLRSLDREKASPLSLLTEKQMDVLHTAWQRTLDRYFPEGMATRLEKSGYPLTPAD